MSELTDPILVQVMAGMKQQQNVPGNTGSYM